MGLLDSGPLSSPEAQIMLAAGLLGGRGNLGANLGQGLLGAVQAQQQERANRASDLQQLSGAYNLLKQQEFGKMLAAKQSGQPYIPNPMLPQMEARIAQLTGLPNLSNQGPVASRVMQAPQTPPMPPQGAQAPQGTPPMPAQANAAPMQSMPAQANAMPAMPQSASPFGGPAFGIDPLEFMSVDPSGKQYMEALLKQAAPITTRFGVYTMNPRTGKADLAGGMIPRDALPVAFGPDGQPKIQALPGQIQTQQDLEAASQRGKQGETYVEVDIGNGQKMRMTNAQYEAMRRGQPQAQDTIPPEVIAADRAGVPFTATQAPGGPVQFGSPPVAKVTVTQPSPFAGGGGGLGVSPNPVLQAGATAGAQSAAKNQQSVIKDDYQDLARQNVNAQTVMSRLQTIKQLGPQAITGAESEKRDFFNGLLSLVGVKAATDAKTASDLVDKNAAQIALAIGTGPQGTDALRSLAQMANPNRKMTVEAIQRAADSIIAPLAMTQAKTGMLTPYFAHGDAQGYLQQKQLFEKAADPRVWELQSMSPEAQKAYVSGLSPADAKDLLTKRQTLKQLGVLQ